MDIDIDKAIEEFTPAFKQLVREKCLLNGVKADEDTIQAATDVMLEINDLTIKNPETVADIYVAAMRKKDKDKEND